MRARVVHDVVTQRGALVENTYDWYAQDRAGNVWYLGESRRRRNTAQSHSERRADPALVLGESLGAPRRVERVLEG